MGHVCLLGDSIFDNAAYVGREPPVIEHLRRALPTGWCASLEAVDGDSANDVRGQLGRLDGTRRTSSSVRVETTHTTPMESSASPS